jgi:ubiquinone/menaquinone biosynthesis C-methylase UbiE
MGVYATHILPHVLHLSMRGKAVTAERQKFVPLAEGSVLEIGMGSGLNLPYYGAQVDRVFGLEPSMGLRAKAKKLASATAFPVEFIGLDAQQIPLDAQDIDTVVSTWTLCTIPNAAQALSEIRRVLKPDGRLIFVEHGRSPDQGVAKWQNRMNGVQNRIAGGCNLNRPIDIMIRACGFNIAELEVGYLKGPKAWSYHYKGVARPA